VDVHIKQPEESSTYFAGCRETSIALPHNLLPDESTGSRSRTIHSCSPVALWIVNPTLKV
jgi:hypothetical protein